MLRRHPVLSVLTFGYLGFVGWITLGPQPLDARASGWLYGVIARLAQHPSLAWLTYDRVEFLANIALFVPVGVLFLLLFGRRWWWLGIAAGALLTCSIEFTQQFIPTRVPDAGDLVANTTGAALGAVVALVVTTPAAIRHEHARRAALSR